MTVYVALVRGINVGGRKKLAMSDLRRLLESEGYEDVRTLLQSGNAVFRTPRADPAGIASDLEAALARELGLDAKVLVRTREEVQATIEANPLPGATKTPAQFVVVFLSETPSKARIASVDPAAYPDVEFRFGDRVVYAWYREGIGRSRLTGDVWERFGVVATARNWTTLTKLYEAASALEG